MTSSTHHGGVLLLGADYYGTLAAARSYGKHGIRVTMADANPRARGLYSRHVCERQKHPPLSEPERLLEWLIDFGAKHPRTLLYPPNDHLAWFFAAHRDELAKVFVCFSPNEEVLITLLDKVRLHAACAGAGIDVPRTVSASDPDVARSVRFPVLLKPRTQAFLRGGIKGFVAHDDRELGVQRESFARLMCFDSAITERHPEIVEPMVQEYVAAAETSIFSVAGYVSKDGQLVARSAMKVLQRPRKIGIGLCFEGRPADEEVTRKLAALCQRIGYYGCFEAELIADGERRPLIDFNPRFYSQMAFEIARGLDLPMLVWYAAHGETEREAAELERARVWKATGEEVYCHKTMLDLLLTLQRISGRMPRAEAEKWRSWYATHDSAGVVTDAVRDADDRMPSVVDTALWLEHFARHPRSFVRELVLNR